MKEEVIIAIDPDLSKSGVAELNTMTREVTLKTQSFPELIAEITTSFQILDKADKKLIVIVEAGWLNESNWHVKRGDSARLIAAKGKSVGMNQATGKLIVEMLSFNGIDVREVRPLKKCWKGPDGKITHDELAYFVPGLPKRTNAEMRDAALLAWNYAGFPIRVAPIQQKAKTVNVVK